MLNLKVIIGSTRPGRAADHVIPWFTAKAREHGAFDVDVVDPRDWPLPICAETFATVEHRGDGKVLLDDLAWWAMTLYSARSGGALAPAILRHANTENGSQGAESER